MNPNQLAVNGDVVVATLADQVRELSIQVAMAQGTIAALSAEIEALRAPAQEATDG